MSIQGFPARARFVDDQGRLTREAFLALEQLMRLQQQTDSQSAFQDILAPFVVQESTAPEMITQPAQAESPLAFETTYQG